MKIVILILFAFIGFSIVASNYYIESSTAYITYFNPFIAFLFLTGAFLTGAFLMSTVNTCTHFIGLAVFSTASSMAITVKFANEHYIPAIVFFVVILMVLIGCNQNRKEKNANQRQN